MATLSFTPNLRRHLDTPRARAEGATVGQVLDAYFGANPRVRGYVLDDQGAVRKHVAIFLNREPVRDRDRLSDPVGPDDNLFVVQALSGG